MYVFDPQLNREPRSRLRPIKHDDSTGITTLEDRETRAKWIEYYPRPGRYDWGPAVLREEEKTEQIEDWIDTCFNSSSDDDILGLAYDISNDTKLASEAISLIEEKIERLENHKRSIFLENVRLQSKREIKGKSISEIDQSWEKFKLLLNRYETLKNGSNQTGDGQ